MPRPDIHEFDDFIFEQPATMPMFDRVDAFIYGGAIGVVVSLAFFAGGFWYAGMFS